MQSFLHLADLKNAITYKNYEETLKQGEFIWLVVDYITALAVTPGQVKQVRATGFTPDSPASVSASVLIPQVEKTYAFHLDEFNGHSSYVGYESPEGNYNRAFRDQTSAMAYVDLIKFQREVQLETAMGFYGSIADDEEPTE